MADTFFGFDTSINHGDQIQDEVDCIETEEEEYDALNDETFGTLEDSSNLDDWEQQHEQLAGIAESSKHSDQLEQLENSITQFVLDDFDDFRKENTWSYKSGPRNGELFNTPYPSTNQNQVQNYISSRSREDLRPVEAKFSNSKVTQLPIGSAPRKICTVEELERGLITPRPQKPPHPPNFPPQHIQHPLFPPPHPMSRLPPGIHPMNIPGASMRDMPPIPPLGVPPNPGMFRLMSAYPPGLGPHNGPVHPAHRLMQHGNAPFPVNHPLNFPQPNHLLPGRTSQSIQNQQQQHAQVRMMQQQARSSSGQNRQKLQDGHSHLSMVKDEYSGLMSNREKQWLLNIQMLQLNTGTPYFDDYYYTVFKTRKQSNNKENHQLAEKNQRHHHHRNRNNERQEPSNPPLQSRVYTPLQFENSLGKLQCGSVTAPRKIIDTDVVTMDRDQENIAASKETRKTKQLLLELEALYGLMLKMEDLRNPLALTNMEKLRELKQKQRLRELEAAPTPEQKQEVLKLLQQESIPVEENPNDILIKVVNGLMQEEKYTSFLNVRKGKTLLLRLLPHLNVESYGPQLADLWLKVLLSIPVIGRRDSTGDNFLPKLHPFFKRFVQTSRMADILEIVGNLSEVIRQESNSRSTPLSGQGKSPLHFIVGNKFGISTLATMVVRCEYLISSGNATENEQQDWENFIVYLAETIMSTMTPAFPLECVPKQIFNKHCNRASKLTIEKRSALERKIADSI